MRRALLVVVAALACTAAAAPATFTIDDASPALTEDRTVSLSLTNLTDGKLPLTIAPEDCATASPESLPKARSTTVRVTLPEGCDTDFTLSADGTSVDVTPKSAETDPSQWLFLLVFVGALLVIGRIAYAWGIQLTENGKTELHMESSWSFKESWAGNVTVLGGLLTGIFGSSTVAKALLGSDADSAIALATVGAAIALALVGAGPVILAATKTKATDRYSVRGMVLAAGVTVSGGVGELIIVTVTAIRMDFGGFLWKGLAGIAGAAGIALLVIYFVRTVRAMAALYAKAPPDPQGIGAAVAELAVERSLGSRRSASL
jgi:hypothetical protein